MKVVQPKVEIITESNPLKRIELCGRVCYKSENRITDDSAEKFVDRLIVSGHTSVLEHARVRVSLPAVYSEPLMSAAVRSRVVHYSDETVTVNVRDLFTLIPGVTAGDISRLDNADDYMTVRFICDRAIANELVRHRVFSFSQESTRYVSYADGITVVEPLPFDSGDPSTGIRRMTWLRAMNYADNAYSAMIEAGATPQEARNVLPLSTKTELIMTGTFSQWDAMKKLRRDKAAHPQMRYLMELLEAEETEQCLTR